MARSVSIAALLVCWLAALFTSGCDRDQQAIRTYQAPKQPLGAAATTPADAEASSEPAAARQQAPLHASAAGGAGTLRWDVPPDWQATAAGQMRVAAYQVSPQHPEVVLTVIPLGPEAGDLLANVNRWEGQIGLPPSKPQDLARVVKRIEVAGKAVDLIDLSGPENANPRLGLLAAIVPHEGRVWFFKLAGPLQVVAEQREKFEALIRSIRVDEAAPPQVQTAPPTEAAAGELPPGHPPVSGAAPSTAPAASQLPPGHPPIAALAAASDIRYSLPQGWIKDDPRPLRHVSFTVAGSDGQTAEMIVSKLDAAGAGTYLDNMNRWRAQVGLPPIKQGDPQPLQQLVVGGADAAQYDLVGPSKRMLVVVVAKGPDLWFFKFTGPTTLIDQQQAAFERFLSSVQFVTNAPSQSLSRDPDQH